MIHHWFKLTDAELTKMEEGPTIPKKINSYVDYLNDAHNVVSDMLSKWLSV